MRFEILQLRLEILKEMVQNLTDKLLYEKLYGVKLKLERLGPKMTDCNQNRETRVRFAD